MFHHIVPFNCYLPQIGLLNEHFTNKLVFESTPQSAACFVSVLSLTCVNHAKLGKENQPETKRHTNAPLLLKATFFLCQDAIALAHSYPGVASPSGLSYTRNPLAKDVIIPQHCTVFIRGAC